MDIFLDKGTMEFLTVASEFCAFIEKTAKFDRKEYLSKLQKMLSLVYLKTSLLKGSDQEIDGQAEAFLAEYEYEYIRGLVSQKLGHFDSYINIYNSADNDSGYEQAAISTCVADVYHNLKNFVENCRTASEECAEASREELLADFREYWGFRCISLMACVHALVYSPSLTSEDEDDEEQYQNYKTSSQSEGGSFLDRFMETQRR